MAPMTDAFSAASIADPMIPRVARVVKRKREIADVVTLEIEGGAFDFAPGQFNMLTAFGVGEAAISVSGDSANSARLVHTIRAVGAVSRALTELHVGEPIGLRGPFGRGWPMVEAEGRDVIVVAGGLGLAPLRPALYRLFAEREKYGRILLLFGARSPADILFRDELEAWRGRLDVEVEATVDHARGDWRGNVGVVTTLLSRAQFDAANALAMLCGPEIMMRFVANALLERGVAQERVYLSMERNMKCAIGWCGHCQFGPVFICRDGPVFPYSQLRGLIAKKEI
ncbi:Ni/Fe hydrogenase subunit gamma [Methylosinus sporium]|uniref:Ni/Fe hydrogenase subunit gamma n=1 Tax=Methylosinus sporium TaxID=428 RepID=A0A549SCF9_METSR|nr:MULTISPECIES: FAD/NAD(P)-binding protein [Methylosinus]MBU3887737.1 FAD/NAD(P)-binding protein [Methylosinus sp. KRF6]TRL21180.1 Ni/Fe hydrogenase subunit gamma [Methylosinus sporium]